MFWLAERQVFSVAQILTVPSLHCWQVQDLGVALARIDDADDHETALMKQLEDRLAEEGGGKHFDL